MSLPATTRHAGQPARLYLPGDILGFSACAPLGAAINVCTWGIPGWGLSHVAIVSERLHTGERVLYESTSQCSQPCLEAGELVEGVQVHRIGARIRLYPGRVWHYPLSHTLSDDQTDRLACFLSHQVGKGYDAIGAFRVREAGFGWLESRLTTEDLHSLFCSELVAAALRECGAWKTENASRWNPNRLMRRLVKEGIVGKPVRKR